MKLKKIKKEYWGYICFGIGFLFVVLANVWVWFYFFALASFFVGGIIGLLGAIDHYKDEKLILTREVAAIIEEDLEKQREVYSEEDLSPKKLRELVDTRTMMDYRSYKFGLIWRVILYGFIIALSLLFFIRLWFLV